MPISIYAFLAALALSLSPQAGHGGHYSDGSTTTEAAKMSEKTTVPTGRSDHSKTTCAVLETCFSHFRKPDRIVCRPDGFCIPATPAWTRDRPTRSDHAFRGGFQMAPMDDPIEVPVPASMMTLASAILALVVCFSGRRKIR